MRDTITRLRIGVIIAAAVVLALFGAGIAAADVVGDAADIPLQPVDWNESISVAQFDPALGSLDSVELSVSGVVAGIIRAENTSTTSACSATFTLAADVGLTAVPGVGDLVVMPSVVETADLAIFDGTIDFAGDSGVEFLDLLGTTTASATINDPGALAGFIGNGDVTFDAFASGASSSEGCGNLIQLFQTDAGMTVEILYTFTPAQLNPAISIEKTPDLQTVTSGGTAVFDIVVENTGDVPLIDVNVSDALSPGCDRHFDRLEVDQIETYTCELSGVTAGFVNVATVKATDESGTPVEDSDDAEVVVPGLTVVKSNDANGDGVFSDVEVVIGDGVVTFEVTITAAGAPIVIESISDDIHGSNSALVTAQPGLTSCADVIGLIVEPGSPVTCYFDATVSVSSGDGFLIPGDDRKYHFEFVFEHTDGSTTVVRGASDTNEPFVPDAGGFDKDNPTGLYLHVSCSDEFPGGWGEKEGPQPDTDPEWRVKQYRISKTKDGEVDKTCGAEGSGSEIDTVTVSGTAGGLTLTDDDTSTVLAGGDAGLVVVKSNDANRDGIYSDVEVLVGDGAVTFEVTITPSGGPFVVESVSDDIHGSNADLVTVQPGLTSCADVIGLTVVPGDSVTCYFDATVDVTAGGPFLIPGDDRKLHFEFVFQHTDGSTTVVQGASDDNEPFVPQAGGSDKDNPSGLFLHVSCSDEFPDGWGKKEGPQPDTDPEWRVLEYRISKVKDGEVDKTCGADGESEVDTVTVSGTAGGLTLTDDDTSTVLAAHDPAAFEGCTPGYWKNKKRLHVWFFYAPSDSFADVFGVDYDLTLQAAINKGGGKEKALGRHAVAALLNASHPNVNYGLTQAEVIAIVQEAWATGEFNDAKDVLEDFNKARCSLDGKGNPKPPKKKK